MAPARRTTPPLLALALVACNGGGSTTYTGHNTYEYMPLDGERNWTYTADTDAGTPNVDYNLFVEKVDTEVAGTTEKVTLEYRNDNTGDLLYSIVWSADAADGILVHGFDVQGGDSVTFDTPISFAKYKMIVGDEVESSSNGITVVSTLSGLEDCPNYWTTQVWECLHFSVDDGGAGTPFAGEWWLAGSWGASRFRTTDVDQDWVLASGYWSGE
ncbi:MAG: hypothetical protein D6798_18405 [Deltaproteobacteria bacterium]|nr:MAG: hypothetical protein D6798_18405 [Deltaproteobacteria bacterium]